MPDTLPLVARELRKRYGDLDALDGLDLSIEAGRIHGLLGPNGAGKSTAVKALATLIRLDGGEARIDGFDVRSEGRRVRERIGLVGQHAALDEKLGGRQNLVMFGRLSGLSAAAAASRGDELLERFGLVEVGSRSVSTYSGGMRRRLDIAASLILTPAVLFLDEPTTGLDPRGRLEVWDAVRAIAATGTAVLLTTQYLDEADQLANQITVLKSGRAVASDSPLALKEALGGDRVVVVVPSEASIDAVVAALGDGASVDADRREVTVPAPNGASDLVRAVRELDRLDVAPDDLALRRPTLDEVFLALTGSGAGPVADPSMTASTPQESE